MQACILSVTLTQMSVWSKLAHQTSPNLTDLKRCNGEESQANDSYN